jgi:transcriptional regulator with XRE-family HTH domain
MVGLRANRRLGQDDVAQRMKTLGHDWTRTTVSEVEGAGRGLRVEELLSLSIAIGVPLADLLDPTTGSRSQNVDIGPRPMAATMAAAWIRGRAIVSMVSEGDWHLRFEQATPPQVSYMAGAIAQSRVQSGLPATIDAEGEDLIATIRYVPPEGDEGGQQ